MMGSVPIFRTPLELMRDLDRVDTLIVEVGRVR